MGNNKRKIAVVIASRANYGRAKSLLQEIKNRKDLELQIIVSASALLRKYGNVSELIKVAIQVNGKTRDIIKIEKDNSEQEIHKEIMKDSKAKKYIENKKIRKTIFVKNKIINYII